MSEESEPITEMQVERYLDHLMTSEEMKEFEERLRAHPEVFDDIELQGRIDRSMRLLFQPESIAEEHLHALTDGNPDSTSEDVALADSRWTKPKKWQVALVAVAAGLAWIIIGWQSAERTNRGIFFEPRSVAAIYQDTVRAGFEPYYECREDDRFAETFLRRQGIALQLQEMPAGSEMLGLSYPGGLSRDTTAMLCQVDGQHVMVFVDRLESDSKVAMQEQVVGVQVFREARSGLVFYEVTPYEISRVSKYLVP